MKAVKPGVVWTDMHLLANRVILEDLLQGGLVKVRLFTGIWPGLTEFGPPMWQAEADTDLTFSASPATAVSEILLTMAKFC